MKLTKNEGDLDRFLRVLIAELLLLSALFWVGGVVAIVFYVLAVVLLFTSITGFCALYPLLKINTVNSFKFNNLHKFFAIAILLVVGILGGYYSNFFTKKIFLEDYNRMNNFYKQTLFYTGQNKRPEAIENYAKLVDVYPEFLNKYTNYHPVFLKFDNKFNSDIKEISEMIVVLEDQIGSGDLVSVHQKLELIRPMFQDILKRNGFSMLAVALVDFHDVMENVIAAADERDAEAVKVAYVEASDKLKAVEAEANDEEIKVIRQRLEEVLDLAEKNDVDALSAKAAELKSAFIKVYLKRG